MESLMRCPIDGRELTPLQYEEAIIHTCESCGGELLGAEALTHVVNCREKVYGSRYQQLVEVSKPLGGVPSKNLQSGICCPVCAAKMQTVNYLGEAAVHIDRCLACHAVWLDPNELEQVQVLVESWQQRAPQQLALVAGKLEAARMRAAEVGDASFQGSRFAFVNALMNRLLDAA